MGLVPEFWLGVVELEAGHSTQLHIIPHTFVRCLTVLSPPPTWNTQHYCVPLPGQCTQNQLLGTYVAGCL